MKLYATDESYEACLAECTAIAASMRSVMSDKFSLSMSASESGIYLIVTVKPEMYSARVSTSESLNLSCLFSPNRDENSRSLLVELPDVLSNHDLLVAEIDRLRSLCEQPYGSLRHAIQNWNEVERILLNLDTFHCLLLSPFLQS
jgi:hypothetical protein